MERALAARIALRETILGDRQERILRNRLAWHAARTAIAVIRQRDILNIVSRIIFHKEQSDAGDIVPVIVTVDAGSAAGDGCLTSNVIGVPGLFGWLGVKKQGRKARGAFGGFEFAGGA
ncbi:hypothetical protein [Bifidobacterium vespertilionis]|uniref:hypothetical protein n=1 Tax=Bifidobacterium vespertilionis TaxID=2562524 RepID=UPI001CC2F83A|nr:hypothetical protein [Bifidobacterium vespertilionis]